MDNNRVQDIVLNYILPIIIQLVILFIFLSMHRIAIEQGETIMPIMQVGSEISQPTMGRMIYMITALIIGLITSNIAHRISLKGSKKNTLISFWIGVCAGIFLWQAIGEDSWNFGIQTENGFVNFIQLQSPEAIFVMIMFLIFLIHTIRRGALSFGMGIVITSFLCNWLGHGAILIVYAFVEKYFERGQWFLISSGLVGIIFLMSSIIYVVTKQRTLKQNLFLPMITYIGLGMIAMAIVEG